MKTIYLEPLNKRPLSSQMYDHIEEHYNNDTVKHERGYFHTLKNVLFVTASAEAEEAYKVEEEARQEAEAETKKHKYDHVKPRL